jgi:prepilin-type N-terminal cleavage/methylation domain-containing protein
MFSRNTEPIRGFTLIEVLVACFIFTIVGTAIFSAWSYIRHNQAVAEARGQAKSDVEIVCRTLERDIAMARAKTIAGTGGADGIAMKITHNPGGAAGVPRDIDVTFSRSGNRFSRTADGTTNTLTNHLKEFTWEREANASGVIYLKVLVEVPVQGYTNTWQTHAHESMATVREEAVGAGVTERWQKSEDLLKNW